MLSSPIHLTVLIVSDAPKHEFSPAEQTAIRELSQCADRLHFQIQFIKTSHQNLSETWMKDIPKSKDSYVLHTTDLTRLPSIAFGKSLQAILDCPHRAILTHSPAKAPYRKFTRFLLKIMSGYWIEDPMSDIQIYPSSHLAQLTGDRFGRVFQIQILCSILARRMNFLEVSLPEPGPRPKTPKKQLPSLFRWRASIAAMGVAAGLLRNPSVPFRN